MESIEPCLQAEMMMERLRREARNMSREQLLEALDALSELYAKQRAITVWAVKEAASTLGETGLPLRGL